MRRMRIIGIVLLSLAGACAFVGRGSQAAPRMAEQEVLMMIIAQHGRGAVLKDSTFGHRCMERRTPRCDDASAPQVPWQAYLQASSRPFSLRELLPPHAGLRYESDLGDQSALPCEQRTGKLQLSRVGFSRDRRWGIVSYAVSLPTTGPWCSHTYGAGVVVRRQQDGTWTIDRPLWTTVT